MFAQHQLSNRVVFNLAHFRVKIPFELKHVQLTYLHTGISCIEWTKYVRHILYFRRKNSLISPRCDFVYYLPLSCV